jgi:hypothetical protein
VADFSISSRLASHPYAVDLPEEAVLADGVDQTSRSKDIGTSFLKDPWLRYAFLATGKVTVLGRAATARLSAVAAETGISSAAETVSTGVGITVTGALMLIGMVFAAGDSRTPQDYSNTPPEHALTPTELRCMGNPYDISPECVAARMQSSAAHSAAPDLHAARASATTEIGATAAAGAALPVIDLAEAVTVTLADLQGGSFLKAGGNTDDAEWRVFYLSEAPELLGQLQSGDPSVRQTAEQKLKDDLGLDNASLTQLRADIAAVAKERAQIKLPSKFVTWLMALPTTKGGDPQAFPTLDAETSTKLDDVLASPTSREAFFSKLVDTTNYQAPMWIYDLLQAVTERYPDEVMSTIGTMASARQRRIDRYANELLAGQSIDPEALQLAWDLVQLLDKLSSLFKQIDLAKRASKNHYWDGDAVAYYESAAERLDTALKQLSRRAPHLLPVGYRPMK